MVNGATGRLPVRNLVGRGPGSGRSPGCGPSWEPSRPGNCGIPAHAGGIFVQAGQHRHRVRPSGVGGCAGARWPQSVLEPLTVSRLAAQLHPDVGHRALLPAVVILIVWRPRSVSDGVRLGEPANDGHTGDEADPPVRAASRGAGLVVRVWWCWSGGGQPDPAHARRHTMGRDPVTASRWPIWGYRTDFVANLWVL